MPWKRSDDVPITQVDNDTYMRGWRNMGCGCCSTTKGFDLDPDGLYEQITIPELEQIKTDLQTQLALVERDLQDMKKRNDAQITREGT